MRINLGKVFPYVPDTLYAVIVERRPRVQIWCTRRSYKKAREEGKNAKSMNPRKRVLIIAYEMRSCYGQGRKPRFTRREVK